MPVESAVTIDLHSHVLPGIDDGPKTLIDSLAMAAVAVRTGTRVLAATPHVRNDYPGVRPLEIADRVAELNAALAEKEIGLRVVPGGEVALVDALQRPQEELDAVTLGANGRALLVETPHGPLPRTFESLVEGVLARGYSVVLAHPELNPDLQRDPGRAAALADIDGVLLQVTASSLAPEKGAPRRRLARRLLAEGRIGLLASDAHRAGWRPPDLAEAVLVASAEDPRFARELAWLATVAPAAVLAGAPLPQRPQPEPVAEKRGLFGRRR